MNTFTWSMTDNTPLVLVVSKQLGPFVDLVSSFCHKKNLPLIHPHDIFKNNQKPSVTFAISVLRDTIIRKIVRAHAMYNVALFLYIHPDHLPFLPLTIRHKVTWLAVEPTQNRSFRRHLLTEWNISIPAKSLRRQWHIVYAGDHDSTSNPWIYKLPIHNTKLASWGRQLFYEMWNDLYA